MSAPVVIISVYRRARGLTTRRKYRQWRSVQSIIGATHNRCDRSVTRSKSSTIGRSNEALERLTILPVLPALPRAALFPGFREWPPLGRITPSVIASPRRTGRQSARSPPRGTAAPACLGRKLDFRFDSV